jgi:hypothetical protein
MRGIAGGLLPPIRERVAHPLRVGNLQSCNPLTPFAQLTPMAAQLDLINARGVNSHLRDAPIPCSSFVAWPGPRGGQ